MCEYSDDRARSKIARSRSTVTQATSVIGSGFEELRTILGGLETIFGCTFFGCNQVYHLALQSDASVTVGSDRVRRLQSSAICRWENRLSLQIYG
jgi:hypothetical protein